MSAARSAVLNAVAERLLAREPGHPLRVGVDGVCGSGKSTFTRELAGVLPGSTDRQIVLVDSDGFHHVRSHRYRQGRESARGYYEDGYDFDSVADRVLRPLGPDGDRRFATAVHDLATDAVIDGASSTCAPDAIVLFEATFLQRGALRDLWDLVIWLDVDLDVARERGVRRDADALGGPDAARAAYDARYLAACRLYLAEESPRERADLVIGHDDPARPRIIRDVPPTTSSDSAADAIH